MWWLRGNFWAVWLRQRLNASEKGGQLIIERRWQPHAFALSLYGLFMVVMLWTPWATTEVQHFLHYHPSYTLIVRLIGLLLLVAPVIYAYRLGLRRRRFVFDRTHDFVTCNDQVICALSEVESVRVGKRLNSEADQNVLEVLIHGRNEVSIDWDDLLGVGREELGLAGLAISEYAQIPLWAENAWRDPRSLSAEPLGTRLSPRILPYRVGHRVPWTRK